MTSTSQDDASQPKKNFYCEMCNVNCLSNVSFQAHIRGAKHLKVIRANKAMGLVPIPVKKFNSLKDFINDPERTEPLIGLKYVEEGRKLKGKRHYRCTLCNLDMAMQIMFDHLIGHKHRRTYLNKHFPLLIKGVQTPTVAVLKTLAKEVEEEEGLQTYETNVPITLKPLPPVKPAENSSQHSAPGKNTIQPRQTTADDIIEKLENVSKPEMASNNLSSRPTENISRVNMDHTPHQYKRPEITEKYSSSRDTENLSRRHTDHSPHRYTNPDIAAKHASSRDTEHRSKRSREHSPPQYKKPEMTAKHYSSRDTEYHSKRRRDHSPPRSKKPEMTAKHPSSRDAEHLSQRKWDYSPPEYKKHEVTAKHPSTRDSEHLSQRHRDRSPPEYTNPEMTAKHPSSRDAEHLSQRDRDHWSSESKSTIHFKSAYRKENALEYLQTFEITSDAEAGIVASLTQHLIKRLGTYTGTKGMAPQTKKTYETGHHHSGSGNEDYKEHQGSSGIATYQQDYVMQSQSHEHDQHHQSRDTRSSEDMPSDFHDPPSSCVQSLQETKSSTTAGANSGGLSPDILNILRGKDVQTVTSILNRLAQYYPPLQNVDIPLLVSVLFESGALQ